MTKDEIEARISAIDQEIDEQAGIIANAECERWRLEDERDRLEEELADVDLEKDELAVCRTDPRQIGLPL